ncbi:4036_t:CDS:2 [Funneliformis caledonium]|uniref:4036_t:CDS:1 n=1 Tax=Funneliformis caledonium TaxID=1117310 RepID=A0A9N8VF81_9GLOM|nr:4036_t:CDS:2 [Funneliformis caledonium]
MSQTPPKSKLPEQKSALDVAVNQLVRASVGGSVPPTLPDEDLDKYIADLVLKEASVKNKMYNKEGIRAYLPHTGTSQPCNLPKTNKRFLINVVKNVDYHNQALLRKIEEEAAARRIALRRKVSSRQRDSYSRNSRTRKLSSDRYYSDNIDSDSDSDSSSRGRRLSRRRRYYSRSPSYDNRKSSSTREKSSRRSVSPGKDNYNSRFISSREERVNLSTDSKNKPTSETNVVRKKGRGEVSNGSKMDKYFRKDYDPMFDVEPFIGEPGWYNFDRFEQMFAEKSEKSSSKSKKKRRRDSDDETSDSNEDVETNIKKRRKNDNNHKTIVSVREWDKPKLVFGNWDLDKTI